MSARSAAQAAVNKQKKLRFNTFDGGRYAISDEDHTAVLSTPNTNNIYAYHFQAVRFFRNHTEGTTKLTSTSLRNVIAADRGWLVEILRSGKIPCGKDLLAVERGDVAAREAADRARKLEEQKAVAAEKKQRREEERAAKAAAAAVAAEAAAVAKAQTQTKPTNNGKKRFPMALIDVETKTQKVIITETQHSVRVGRTELIAFLRSNGLEGCPKTADIILPNPGGDPKNPRVLEDHEGILVRWTETKEETVSE